MSDCTEKIKKRLIFRSWHRGTREMDLIMGAFAERYVQDMSEEELALYDELLQNSDPDLYNWITGQKTLPDAQRTPVMENLLNDYDATTRKTGICKR